MKLDRYQILNILNIEKVAPDNTGVYTINFEILLDKLSLTDSDKNLIKTIYKNNHINTEKEHLNKVAQLLDGKIESATDDFWELLFFRKHSYHSDYINRKWNEFNESYESIDIVKKRIKVLKELNVNQEELEIFLKKLTYQQDGYIDLWFSLKKKNKDTVLDERMKEIILKYGSLDVNEGKKAVMLSYFNEIKELELLYENNKNSAFRRKIEEELMKHKEIEKSTVNLFEEIEYHNVIYRKNVVINENALIYELNKDKKIVDKIVKVVDDFLNKEIYQLKKEYFQEKYTYTIEGYSEEHLKDREGLIKKSFIYLPELLIKKEYEKLFKEETYINEELNQFFKQYIKSAEIYKKLNQQMPEKNNKEKKIKI